MIQFEDPKGRKFSPSYRSESLEQTALKFKEFLTQAERQMLLRETDDPEIGERYIQENIDEIKIDTVMEYATEKLQALLEVCKDEGLEDEEIVQMMLDCRLVNEYGENVEAVGPGFSHNSLLRVPVGAFTVDMNEIAGKLNTVHYPNLFQTFLDHLTPAAAKDILEKSSVEDDGTLMLDAPKDHWEISVDEDAFKDKVIDRLGVEEDAFEEEHPVVA